MIRSMTGFGRCELSDNNRKITVEIKSVNHRYLDLNIKLPKKLNYFEAEIRNQLKRYAQRGKLDVFISYEDFSGPALTVQYNPEIAREYLQCLRNMEQEFGLANDISASTLSRYPEVFTMHEQTPDEDEILHMLEKAVDGACEGFVETRMREGTNLRHNLEEKLNGMAENVRKVEERAPKIMEEYRRKLDEHIREILSDRQIDENRLATEIVLYADKICTDEETVRLKSHIESMLEALDTDDGIGRKMDFIAQEMNREANTILSKANDLETADIAIDLKTEIEKIREQIQNIE